VPKSMKCLEKKKWNWQRNQPKQVLSAKTWKIWATK
jgi:hypothetical protein